jgi:hypothetical protein
VVRQNCSGFERQRYMGLTLFLFYHVRDAWKGFSGMPKHNAALSYVYIVSSLLDPDKSGAFSNVCPASYM